MATFFIGVDPGKSGGAALIDEHGIIHSTTKFTESEHDINEWFLAIDMAHAVIEKVHSFPGQGVKSMFTFGQSYGFLRAMLVAHSMPFTAVAPGTWQRAQSCLTKGDKRVTYRRAQELFPDIKVTHAIADALLIADYARKLNHG